MERRLFEPPPPAVPVPLESLGLREVLVTEALPWEGRIAWYPKEERGYVYGRFGNYFLHILALARGDASPPTLNGIR